jgi:hypothetical protein
MPPAFDKCRENGGKIRTVSGPNKDHGLKKNEYVHVCILNGETYRGYVKKKKKKE